MVVLGCIELVLKHMRNFDYIQKSRVRKRKEISCDIKICSKTHQSVVRPWIIHYWRFFKLWFSLFRRSNLISSCKGRSNFQDISWRFCTHSTKGIHKSRDKGRQNKISLAACRCAMITGSYRLLVIRNRCTFRQRWRCLLMTFISSRSVVAFINYSGLDLE